MKPFRSGDVKLPPLNITEVRETSARGQVPGETDPKTVSCQAGGVFWEKLGKVVETILRREEGEL